MEIKREIYDTLKKKLGKLSYKLIYTNNEEKNYVFLISNKNIKYVLKVKNKNNKEQFDNEIKGRNELSKIFRNCGIKDAVITAIKDYNKNQNWILFKYMKFDTLYDIYKKDKKKFKKAILHIYNNFFPKLFKKNKLNKKIPGEFSLQDIGYYNGKIYFYDLEANKELINQYIDLYAKIGKIYFRKVDKPKEKVFLERIINKIKTAPLKLDKGRLNNILIKRLKTKTFKEFDKEKYQKYKEEILFQ